MPQLDAIVCDHIENRLLQPERLKEVPASILDRCEERAERRREHIAELSRRAAETELRLKPLYEAIEAAAADLDDPALKKRVVALRALGDQAQVDAERAPAMRESSGNMAAATGGTICALLPSASKSEMAMFASWDRRANCCARSLRSLAGNRRESPCPLWD